MQVNFKRGLTDLEGKEIKNPDQSVVTLGKIAIEALLATFQDEQNLAGEEKLKRWSLAMRIQKGEGEIEVSADEIALVKKLIGKAYGPMIVGQTWEMLEGGGK